jgi:prepilin-type N-terminal cleavage/methylation domain-containing protein
MRPTHPDWFAACKGFTLVESIIVLVTLGIAAVAIISLQHNIFYGLSQDKDIQVSTRLVQACAEHILAIARQSGGYSSITLAGPGTAATTSCGNLPTVSGYNAPSVTIADGNSGSIATTYSKWDACPYSSGALCKLVSITLTGSGLTPVVLMLANY